MNRRILPLLLLSSFLYLGCGDDGETEADRRGVGAQCTSTANCQEDEGLSCLTQFRGGYCGKSPCSANSDCPAGSACVAHTDGQNYCFRSCVDKAECNANRSVDNEANCSANITFVQPGTPGKACVPPSGS